MITRNHVHLHYGLMVMVKFWAPLAALPGPSSWATTLAPTVTCVTVSAGVKVRAPSSLTWGITENAPSLSVDTLKVTACPLSSDGPALMPDAQGSWVNPS